ncbi:MAG TPA: hypothetical protein VHX38_26860 [Pseudonocardiaceae bacterium]|jgi:hypothetical protein|nr:hypothetical protein [Pseudonocardiaceae bacterium]
MLDPLLVGLLLFDALFGSSLILRTIAGKVGTLIKRHRNRRWVRTRASVRPAHPPIKRAEPAPTQTTAGAAGDETLAAPAVFNGERWCVRL